ncbi:hypothetical protein SAMN04487956_14916 [Halomonas saccharevitans]|uniref:Uncharacterized protein n=2 Tax=Halomonas saccharevitans TaxID=416872 RepID=A0A1I7CKZ4_9GAMM|nr:hypothetical protein SAMN04487956_14916 [Halomonas saccharevitans]
MSDLFIVILLVALLALIVGAINPRWALPWSSKPKRLSAIGLYSAIVVASFVGFGLTMDAETAKQGSEETSQQRAGGDDITAAESEAAAEPDPEPLSPAERVAQRMPENQQEFLSVMANAAAEYDDAPNELVQSRIDRERKSASREFVGDGGLVTNWVGILESLGTNGDGNGIVTIRANEQVVFKTWNNALSDIDARTLIPHDSELYETLAGLSKGAAVSFSGRLIDEGSMTEKGSVMEPEFIVRFSSITPLN